MTIKTTDSPKKIPPYSQLLFGKNLSDHMLQVQWTKANGWEKPEIVPLHNLSLSPASSSLHYAIQCFEGLKAYKNDKDEVFLFRPDKNADRLNSSTARLGLPTFDKEEFIKCMAELVKIEERWIPKERGYSLYIRPTVISNDDTLGVNPPTKALLYIILSPVGPYFPTGFAPVKLFADPNFIRAFPGGTGNVKVGSNYAPTIYPTLRAQEKGYSQILWLYGPEHRIEEVGTMNLFVFWTNEKGQEELITAPLSNGTILPGVTRDSVIQICKQKGMNVQERSFTIHDVEKASKEGRVKEVFGAGTACIVCPVSAINFDGQDINVPTPEFGLARTLFDEITSIQRGEIQSNFVVQVKDILGE